MNNKVLTVLGALALGSSASLSLAQLPTGYSLSSVPGVLASGVPAIDGVAAISANRLYVYGINLCVNDQQPVCQNKKAKMYNGSAWTAMGQGIYGNFARAHATTDNGSVYLVGDFSEVFQSDNTSVAGARHIALWNGSAWSSVGHGVGNYGSINSVAAKNDTQVFVGGNMEGMRNNANSSVEVSNIAYWNGSAWSEVGAGLDDSVRALAYNHKTDTLYAAGSFDKAYGYGNFSEQRLEGIGKWTAAAGWQPLGYGMGGVKNIVVSDDGNTVFVSGTYGANAGGFDSYNKVSGTEHLAYYTQAKGWQGFGRSGLNFTIKDAGAMALLPDQNRIVARLLGTDGIARVAVWSMSSKKWQVLYSADYGVATGLGLDRAISIAGDSIYVGDKVTSVTAGSQNYTINSMAKITVADIDGDGFDGANDNCPGMPNPDQADLDNDGIGDLCDDDIDGDGVANHLDRMPYDASYTTTTKPVASGLYGQVAGEKFGTSVLALNDLNGDNYLDYAVAASQATVIVNGKKLPKAGRVDVYSGFNDQLLFSVEGQAKGEQLGHAIAAGNLDSTSRDELVISSIAADKKAGKVLVVYNGDPSDTVTLRGGKAEQLGFDVHVGDVEGNTGTGLLISSIMANKKAGRVYVLTRSQVHAGDLSAAQTIDGPVKGEFGYSLAVSESGKKILVGAPKADKTGRVYFYRAPLNASDVSAHKSRKGEINGERFGHRVVAQLGNDAVAISAPFYKKDKLAKAGRVQTARFVANSDHVINGVDIYGQNKGEQLGLGLAVGRLDYGAYVLLVGSPFAPSNDSKPLKKAGRVDIYTNWSSVTAAHTIYGRQANQQLGMSMATVDVTGDNKLDLLCGVPTAANGKSKNSGQAFFVDAVTFD